MIGVILATMFVIGVLVLARAASRRSGISGGTAGPTTTPGDSYPFWADGGGATSAGSADCDPAADCGTSDSRGGGE